ncbi:MAG: type I-E CRISPR-associated protein Cas6/Cse3/CasE [Bryobacterales bacterium]|nr:type I-E CRISPR-associated protein Cas6/Cse3/CasE [Bryobacterales bacterium]MDE0295195.1 type I-E CRISPR-associated protein Cas6/Cse3/CasE [Bryobacterales bacterium]
MADLHLVRLPLNLREFTAWALGRRYLDTPPGDGRGRPRDAEMGYALHAALSGLFGVQSPRPFAIPLASRHERQRAAAASGSPGGMLDLLGYTRAPLETLRSLVQFADDELRTTVNWEGARSKPMPSRWPKNLRLRFDLRACPVRRIMKPLTTREYLKLQPTTFCKGRELDAFQVAAARRPPRSEPPAREQVYIEWLEERLASQPERPQAVALVPNSLRVEAYRSVRLLRRPRGENGRRAPQWLTRPDVHFTGLLDITSPDTFSDLLARGVGRHCGFGFGMLLLKPA